jgi:hypothetical protein
MNPEQITTRATLSDLRAAGTAAKPAAAKPERTPKATARAKPAKKRG